MIEVAFSTEAHFSQMPRAWVKLTTTTKKQNKKQIKQNKVSMSFHLLVLIIFERNKPSIVVLYRNSKYQVPSLEGGVTQLANQEHKSD